MLPAVILLITVFGYPWHTTEASAATGQVRIQSPPGHPVEVECMAHFKKVDYSDFVISQDTIRLLFFHGHYGLRIAVASNETYSGVYIGGKGVYYGGPASNMYRLDQNLFLEALAKGYLYKSASPSLVFGTNYYTSKIPRGSVIANYAKEALDSWMNSTETLNQMLFSKATQLGCSYKLSKNEDENGLTTLEMACVYDKKYQGGSPYTKGPGCRKDSDCTTYPDSTCMAGYHICERYY